MAGRVSIVVLNWNRAEETLDCLTSLSRLDYQDYGVIVVDNGSTDGSAARIREAWPAIRLIETGANLGYGAGNNAGIKAALTAGSDFVWVLNNDTVVEPGALRLKLDAVAGKSRVGAVSPKILLKEAHDRIWYAGGDLSARFAKVRRYAAGEKDRGQRDRETLVSFATGCSLLLRREAIEEIGLFNERYFLYWEDIEYCHRLTRAGWQILYEPRAVVYHTGGGSGDEPGGRSALFDYYNTRNLFWYLREHLPMPERLLAEAYNLGYLARRAGTLILSNERRKHEKLRALAQGMRHGLFAPYKDQEQVMRAVN